MKLILDVSSITTLLTVLAGLLPVIASLLTVIWMGYRVAEEHAKRQDRLKDKK